MKRPNLARPAHLTQTGKRRRQDLRIIAHLAAVPAPIAAAVLAAQAALVLEDLASGRRAHLPGLGRLKTRSGRAQRVAHPQTGALLPLPGRPRLALRPGRRLRAVLAQLAEVFE